MNIWVAASDGRIDLVENYISSGNFTANSQDENGYSPIHAAASYGHKDLLTKLIKEYNGDINLKDNDGDTPLHHVEDYQTAQLIVEELNGDFQITNNENKTALQVFEEDNENMELIEYMRFKSGVPMELDSFGINKDELAQFKENIRYSLENDPTENLDEESMARRKKLEEIIQGENPEQELEKYLREVIQASALLEGGTGSNDNNDEPGAKRQR